MLIVQEEKQISRRTVVKSSLVVKWINIRLYDKSPVTIVRNQCNVGGTISMTIAIRVIHQMLVATGNNRLSSVARPAITRPHVAGRRSPGPPVRRQNELSMGSVAVVRQVIRRPEAATTAASRVMDLISSIRVTNDRANQRTASIRSLYNTSRRCQTIYHCYPIQLSLRCSTEYEQSGSDFCVYV